MNLNLIISCFISCYVCDKHNMNLSVLIFLKTYVCKHESNHIEPKPTQKNCSSRSNCLLTNTYYIERFYTIPIRQVGWAFDILLLNFFHSKEPLLKLTTMYNNCHLSQKEKKSHFKVCMLLFWDWVLETFCICQHHCTALRERK